MACSLCLVGIPQVAMIPCGHVCLCELCREAICPVVVCPVCSEVVGNTLKVYFPLAAKVLPPTRQKLLAVLVKELQLATKASNAILALTDWSDVEQEKLECVRFIESWMD